MKPGFNPNPLVATAALVLAVMSSGCARRTAQAPPVPLAPPPAPMSALPETPPPPVEEPAPAPGVTTEDLAPAFFALDSDALSQAARAALDRNAKLLRDRSAVRIVIEGHCDERGSAEYNLALGERRAEAARDHLLAAGVPGDRIRVVSYGKERPFDPGHGETAWARNRRAHVTVN
jgi:peptidoglycan-associated lipoprotein